MIRRDRPWCPNCIASNAETAMWRRIALDRENANAQLRRDLADAEAVIARRPAVTQSGPRAHPGAANDSSTKGTAQTW